MTRPVRVVRSASARILAAMVAVTAGIAAQFLILVVGAAGFELEDVIYLIGPIFWLGWIEPFFLLGAVGVLLFGPWAVFRSLRPGARRGR